MKEHPLVPVQEIVRGIDIDLKYSRADNVFGEALYPGDAQAMLRRNTAEKLKAAQAMLQGRGLRLRVWDAYRPLSVQHRMWEKVPDVRYVADPAAGSSHNRGAAVDVTMADVTGKELEMPTPFDEFSPRAHSGYANCPEEVLKNRRILQEAMTASGFRLLETEWWHFEDTEADSYPVLDIPLEAFGAAP
jgi:D-alanyl-D-alanine dipeptidase